MTITALRRLIAFLIIAGSAIVSTQSHAAILQCAIFARQETQVALSGDAWTWWEQAAGRYHRTNAPVDGGVLVFKRFGKMRNGHVAVVTAIEGDRRIIIDHANWATPGMAKGRISRGVPVIDVSAAGDWSLVRVWNPVTQQFGVRSYPTYGFIDPSRRGVFGEVLNAAATLGGAASTERVVEARLKPSQALRLKQQATASAKGPAVKGAATKGSSTKAVSAKRPATKGKAAVTTVAARSTPALKPTPPRRDAAKANTGSRARPGRTPTVN